MTELLHEIEWSKPILPRVKIPEWESEVRKEMGSVPDILQRASRSPWVRDLLLKWPRYRAKTLPSRMVDICALVTAQENACRYCYGVARAQMKLFGYSERMISNIERNMHLAELDEKEKAMIQFCRNLSRSNPRPPKIDREKLLRLGVSPLSLAELAFLTGAGCFINRMSTFIAVPPMANLERLSESVLGWLLRPLIIRKFKSLEWTETRPLEGDVNSFPGVVQTLHGLPAARTLNDAIKGAFESPLLSDELKMLMFAVIARSLQCPFCEEETRNMAINLGFSEQEFDQALRSLSSPRLSQLELELLNWSRDTVRFQTGPMQRRIKDLAREIDDEVLLEAFGVAALANTTVRIAVLLG